MGNSGQISPQRSDSEFEDEEEQNDIVPGFDKQKNQFDDSLINDLQKDSSFFSYKKDKGEDLIKNMRKVRDDGSSQGSQVRISPIEMIINQGRAFTPTIPFMRQNSDRAPTPTMNRPAFRNRIQFTADARRAQTPAPRFDDQIQSRRNALEILNIQRSSRDEEQPPPEITSAANAELDQTVQTHKTTARDLQNPQTSHNPETAVDQVVRPLVVQKPIPSQHPVPSRLLKSLRIDLGLLSFAFILLAAFLYLEVYHMYALILVPFSEIFLQLSSRSNTKAHNKISDQKMILKQKIEEPKNLPKITCLQKILRWMRWICKILTVGSFIILWIVGESTFLYVSIIPCVVASLVSLLVQAIKFSSVRVSFSRLTCQKSYLDFHLLIFKAVRSLAYLQLMLIIKSNGSLATFMFSQPKSQIWPIIIYFSTCLPANVILAFYSIFTKLRRLRESKNTTHNGSVYGLAYVLLLFTSVSVFLGLFVRYLGEEKSLLENFQVRRLCIAAGIFYAMMVGLSLALQSSLK